MISSTFDMIPRSTSGSDEQLEIAASVTTEAAKRTSDAPGSLGSSALLEGIVAAICLDARRDSLRYALRSNVGHDGE